MESRRQISDFADLGIMAGADVTSSERQENGWRCEFRNQQRNAKMEFSIQPRLPRAIVASVMALGVLAGCATTTQPPVVSLASAQAEASAILTALEAGATVYADASTTTPSEAAAVERVLAVAQAGVAAFQAAQANETPMQLAQTVSQEIVAVLAVLPIDPATKTAIDAGLAVIDALVAGLAVAPAVPIASALPARSEAPLPAPVPIPMPKRLPPRV
jgi:hypothetical protein